MKNSLVVAVSFALVSLVLVALVLAGLGALAASVALPVVALASAALAFVATRTETIEEVVEFERVSRAFPVRAFAAIVVSVPSVTLLVLAVFSAIAL
jgi:hypothetical protein